MESYVQVKQLCEEIKELKKIKHHDSRRLSSSILILGNKVDLLDNNKKKRCVEYAEVQQFCAAFKSCCMYADISCKTLCGLSMAFEAVLIKANLPIEMIPAKHRRLSLNPDAASRSCINNHLPHSNESNSRSGDSVSLKDSYAFSKENKQGSLKEVRRSFKKMTFRRQQLSEACGTILINSRRPSIRSEMKLLESKSDKSKSKISHYNFKTRITANSAPNTNGHEINHNSILNSDDFCNKSRLQSFFFNFRRIFHKK